MIDIDGIINVRVNRTYWTQEQVDILVMRYANERTSYIAESMGRTERSVYLKAHKLGLRKSVEYLASVDSGRYDGRQHNSTSFKKGIIPWNKGMKGLDIGGIDTRFKKGQKPKTIKPIGSERVGTDGLLIRKYSDTGVKAIDWVPVHAYIWIQHNGPIPEGCVIVFKDGNKHNFDLDNLECVTRAELMHRNSVHNLPKELAELCQLRGALTRQINKRVCK